MTRRLLCWQITWAAPKKRGFEDALDGGKGGRRGGRGGGFGGRGGYGRGYGDPYAQGGYGPPAMVAGYGGGYGPPHAYPVVPPQGYASYAPVAYGQPPPPTGYGAPPPPGYAPHGYGYVPQGYVMPQAYVPPAHAGYSGYGFDGGGGHAGTEVLPQQPSMAGQPAGSEGAYGGAANSTSYFSQPPGAAAAVRPAPNAAWYGQTGAYAMQQPGMQLPGVSGGHGPIGSGPYMQQQQQQLQRQPPQQKHGCVSWIWLP